MKERDFSVGKSADQLVCEYLIAIDEGYTPAFGDMFPIISTTSGVSGTFATVSGADLGGGLRFGVSYDALDVTLEVVFAGDGNGDGVVDGLDYLLWAAAFGDDTAANPPGSPQNGDYNDDGTVDGLDYLAWAGNFGAGSATAVPEPAACLLMLTGLGGIIAVVGRRRTHTGRD